MSQFGIPHVFQVQETKRLSRNPLTTKKVFALVFFSLLTGATLLGQAPQSNQHLTLRGVGTLSGQAGVSPTEVGLEVQPYHPGHNAADVRPAMTSGPAVPLVPLAPPMPSPQAVVNPDPGFSGFPGLTHYDQRSANSGNQVSLEPPDQGLCVGNGFVMEAVNLALAVYNSSGTRVSGPTALSPFFGLPPVIDRSTGVRGPFLSDPRCYFDPDIQRWFVSVLEISTDPATGAFTNHSNLHIAVSQSSDPRGSYFLFALDSTDDGTTGMPNHTNCPCFGVQPLIGADANGFYLTTNELSM